MDGLCCVWKRNLGGDLHERGNAVHEHILVCFQQPGRGDGYGLRPMPRTTSIHSTNLDVAHMVKPKLHVQRRKTGHRLWS